MKEFGIPTPADKPLLRKVAKPCESHAAPTFGCAGCIHYAQELAVREYLKTARAPICQPIEYDGMDDPVGIKCGRPMRATRFSRNGAGVMTIYFDCPVHEGWIGADAEFRI